MCFCVVASAVKVDGQSARQHFNENLPFAKYASDAPVRCKPPPNSANVQVGVGFGLGCSCSRSYSVIQLESLVGNRRASRLEAANVAGIQNDGIKLQSGWPVDGSVSRVVSLPTWSMRTLQCEPQTGASVGKKAKQFLRNEWRERAPLTFEEQEERRKTYLNLNRAGRAGAAMVVLLNWSDSGDACMPRDARTVLLDPDDDIDLAHRGSSSCKGLTTLKIGEVVAPAETSSTRSKQIWWKGALPRIFSVTQNKICCQGTSAQSWLSCVANVTLPWLCRTVTRLGAPHNRERGPG